MPPGVNDRDYSRLNNLTGSLDRLEPSDLADLGNVADISLGEFYGAALWQINKTMGSPFKSVLKMALLEEYMFNHGSRGLLCTEMKERLLSDKQDMDMLDPYVLMLDRASTYLIEQNRLDDLDLLRRSFYLKASPRLTLADHRKTELPRKKKLMVNLIREWGWSHSQAEKLNNYQNWGFRESQGFNQEINAFMTKTYKNVSAQLNKQKDQVGLTISQRDMNVLGRKLYVFYSKRTNKIEFLKHVIEDPPVLRGLTIQPYLLSSREKVWGAFRGMLSRDTVSTGVGISALLKNAPNLTEVLIWLVTNQLYDAGTTINLNQGRAT
jgi:adenylate cyclase class 1